MKNKKSGCSKKTAYVNYDRQLLNAVLRTQTICAIKGIRAPRELWNGVTSKAERVRILDAWNFQHNQCTVREIAKYLDVSDLSELEWLLTEPSWWHSDCGHKFFGTLYDIPMYTDSGDLCQWWNDDCDLMFDFNAIHMCCAMVSFPSLNDITLEIKF